MKTIKFKSLLLAIAAIFISSSIMMAQPPQGRHQGQHQGQPRNPQQAPDAQQIKKMVSELKANLELTNEQESKINKLYVDHFKVVSEKLKQGRPERSEMDKLKSNLENNVKSVLNKKQAKLYKKMLKNKSEEQGPQRLN